MNSLIIAMYVAEMLDKWSAAAKFGLVFGGVFTLILVITKLFVIDIFEAPVNIAGSLSRYIKIATAVTIISGLFYGVFPKKEVVYIAMGAKVSEFAIGEIAKSTKLKKISDILEHKLDEILESYNKEK